MKKQIIIFIISFVLIVGIVAIISINNKYAHNNWVEGEEYLYTKAINYVVKDVEKASDYKDKQDYQVFMDYLMYGIEKSDKKEMFICGYFMKNIMSKIISL